jgi:tape measure domain-containing protein
MAERDNGRLLFVSGLDNRQLQSGANQATGILRGVGDRAVAEGNRIDNSFRKIATGLGSVFVFQQASQFISQVARVRGEFQQLEVAFSTMLKSKASADNLMSQIVKTAATTPFDLQGVAGGAKQLLAYGESAESVNDTLIKLGNIAAGLSIPLNDIVYLYGTTMVQGRLFTQDVRQFMGRGIPLIQELSKELGKTEEQINEMVTAGKIGFPEVEKVINNLTKEGGMFFNLMEEQSKTITGQISNLGDAFSQMLNGIGKESEGIISSGIEGLAYLVENYEAIGKILLELVAAYGAYKAVLITLTAIQRTHTLRMEEAAVQQALALRYGRTLTIQQSAQVVVTMRLNRAKQSLLATTKALNKALLANPYAIAALAAVALGYGIYKIITQQTDAEKAQKRLNDELERAKEAKDTLLTKTNELISKIKDETETIYAQTKAWKELNKEIPNAFKGMRQEEFKKLSLDEIKVKINIAVEENDLKEIEEKIKTAKEKIEYLSTQYATPGLGQGGANLITIQIKQETEYLKNLISTQKEMNETRKDAEFNAKPAEERIAYYNTELEKLKKERSELEYILQKSEDVNSVWHGFNLETATSIGRLEQLNKEISEVGGNIKSLSKGDTDTVKNKTYWGNKKKEAEDARDALDVSEKNSSKWKKYQDDITLAQKELEKYANTKNGNGQQKRLEAQLWILNKEKEIANEQLKYKLETEQKLLDLEEDSFEKTRRQNLLNYQKAELDASDHREAMIKKQEEFAKEKYIKKTGNEKGFDFQSIKSDDLEKMMPEGIRPGDVEKEYNSLIAEAMAAYLKSNASLADEMTKMWEEQTYKFADSLSKQLHEIDDYYKERIKKAKGNEELIKTLERDKEYEVSYTINQDYIESGLKRIDYEEKVSEGILDARKSEFVFESIFQLKKNKLYRDYATKRLQLLKSSNAKAGTEEKKSNDEEIRNVQLMIDKLNTESKPVIKDIFNEALSGVSDIADAFKGLNDDIDGAVEGLQEATNLVSQIASGNYIGAAIGVVTSTITKIAQDNKDAIAFNKEVEGKYWDAVNFKIERQIELMKELKGVSSEQVNAGIESAIEDLLNSIRNYDKYYSKFTKDSNKIITEITNTIAQARQRGDKETEDLLNRIMKTWEGNLFGKDGFVNMLSGFSEEELLGLREVADVWKILPAEIQDYINQLAELREKQTEVNEYMKESLTGTTKDSIIDTIISALDEGKSGIDDFAEHFEDMMKKAMLESIKTGYLTEAVNGIYDKFSDMAEDGLTEQEVEQLRQTYQSVAEEAKKRFEAIQQIAGMDFSNEDVSDSENTLKGAYAKASQESIDLLAGQTGAARVALEAIRTTSAISNDSMQLIANSMQYFRDIQTRGWEDVRAIKELTERVSENSDKIRDLSASVSENTRKTATVLDGANTGNSLRVKVMGV